MTLTNCFSNHWTVILIQKNMFFAGKMTWPKASSNGRAGTPRETAGTQPRETCIFSNSAFDSGEEPWYFGLWDCIVLLSACMVLKRFLMPWVIYWKLYAKLQSLRCLFCNKIFLPPFNLCFLRCVFISLTKRYLTLYPVQNFIFRHWLCINGKLSKVKYCALSTWLLATFSHDSKPLGLARKICLNMSENQTKDIFEHLLTTLGCIMYTLYMHAYCIY